MNDSTKVSTLVKLLQTAYKKMQIPVLQNTLVQIRRAVALKRIKAIPKINDLSGEEAQLSSRRMSRNSQYQSIRPLENNYSSIQMVENKGFDFAAEHQAEKALNSLESEPVFEKKQFIEKYLNETKKPILLIEQFPPSIYSTKTIEQYNSGALKNINQSNYQLFFQEVLVKKTFFGKPMNRMEYKATPIRSALTCVEEKYEETAVKMFQKVLKFDDINSPRNRFAYAAELVNYCIKMGEQLIIELYMQLIKQLNGHRIKQYLSLFCVVCATIKVPYRMYVPLLNYFVTNLQKARAQFTYMFYLLIRNFDKPRKMGITDFEAQCIIHMKQIPVTMEMPTELPFFMQTTSSIQDLIQKIVAFFELDKSIKYLIYFSQNYYSTGKLFDCLYYANFQIEDNVPLTNEQIYTRFTGYKVTLTFKNMMHALNSKVNRDILYLFESKKYIQGNFSLHRQEMLMMAAYKYYAENDVLDFADLCLYVPPMLLSYVGESLARRQIVKKFNSIKCTKSEARKKFLKMISDKDVFMALTFYGRLYFDDDDELIIDIVLFIKPGYLTLLGYKDYPLYKTYQIQSIIEWGKTQSEICLRVSKLGFIHIECSSQELVSEIFEGYLKSLAEFVIEDSGKKEKPKKEENKYFDSSSSKN